MGPMRVNWSFPYKGDELVTACTNLEEKLVAELDASITQEIRHDRDLAEYREKLRAAGVANWEYAKMDPTGGFGTAESRFRDTQAKKAKAGRDQTLQTPDRTRHRQRPNPHVQTHRR